MTTLSSHKSPATKTAVAAEPARTTSSPSASGLGDTEVPSVSTEAPTKKPESQPTTSIPITPVKPATPVKPVTPTPAPKVAKVAPTPYFVSVDGCLHPLS